MSKPLFQLRVWVLLAGLLLLLFWGWNSLVGRGDFPGGRGSGGFNMVSDVVPVSGDPAWLWQIEFPKDTLPFQFILSDSSLAPRNYFFNALCLRRELGLRSLQEQTLTRQGFLLPALVAGIRADGGKTFVPRVYEISRLGELLDPRQMEAFLFLCNRPMVIRIVLEHWAAMDKYRLLPEPLTDADSIQICQRLFRYQMERVLANDRFRHDVNQLREAHAFIDREKPAELVRLEVARKTLRSETASPRSTPKGYRGTFRW